LNEALGQKKKFTAADAPTVRRYLSLTDWRRSSSQTNVTATFSKCNALFVGARTIRTYEGAKAMKRDHHLEANPPPADLIDHVAARVVLLALVVAVGLLCT
jgi:hypothetical protein